MRLAPQPPPTRPPIITSAELRDIIRRANVAADEARRATYRAELLSRAAIRRSQALLGRTSS